MSTEESINPFYFAKTDLCEKEGEEPSDIEMQKVANIYRSAMKLIKTRLSILESDFCITYKHNPIHHIEYRLKSSGSILRKLKRKGVDCALGSIARNIFDIVGLRIICPYLEDVYGIANLLLAQNDITLLQRKDYIKSPKQNGYRSLHLVVLVPVMLCHGTEQVPVEIQIRTIAMDMWASMEHELCYKSSRATDKQTVEKLLNCSKELAAIDARMGEMYSSIKGSGKPRVLKEAQTFEGEMNWNMEIRSAK
jgi:putative GTP pyrophosphokinase